MLAAAVSALCACDRAGPPQAPPASADTVELRRDAALYYLYRHHLTNEGVGPQGRYYFSKEGRVFYKDGQGREHTVNSPSDGLRVSRVAAEPYRDIRGYDGRQEGRDLRRIAAKDAKK